MSDFTCMNCKETKRIGYITEGNFQYICDKCNEKEKSMIKLPTSIISVSPEEYEVLLNKDAIWIQDEERLGYIDKEKAKANE